MDKYEYNVKSDQIKKLYSRKDFISAAKIADEIDWYRVKDNVMINKVADIYENTKQYEKAKEILLIAYERSPLGRQLAYKLTILSLRTKNFEEAEEFYQDFVEMSPSDVSQYLLKYRIAKAKGERAEVLIKILESYVSVEMDERWQYELAKLYHEAGQDNKCIDMCKELELWFNEGKYVEKARELRKLISGILEEYNRMYASDEKLSNAKKEITGKVETESVKETVSKDAEEIIKTDNQEIVAKEKELENNVIIDSQKEIESNSKDTNENLGNVEYVESEEERRAKEALVAAELAAAEAQKAADFAKKLVEEARMKANSFKNDLDTKQVKDSEYRIPYGRGNDKYAGMTFDEMRRQMDREDGFLDNPEEDSKIEIYEFDKKKEGKGRIGDELTKTAEIDIDEIKINLSNSNELYNTANIQEALAKSMEKLMGFSENTENVENVSNAVKEENVEDDYLEDFKKPALEDDYDDIDDVVEEVTEENEAVEEEITEENEAVAEEIAEENETVEEEIAEENETVEEEIIEDNETTKEEVEEYFDEEYPKDPTKRINREEINRLLNEIKRVESEDIVEEKSIVKDEQIEGQMTLEEVLAHMEKPIETIKAAVENENIEIREENLEEESREKPEEEKEENNEEDNEENREENKAKESSVSKDSYIMENAIIPENYRSLFNDFVSVGKMEADIAITLENLINHFVMDGTSKTNNIVVTGSSKAGKTTLGLSLIKAANRGRGRSGRKVAKVKATVLNKRGVSLAMTQILGTDLIIEQAGNLMPNTVVDLMIAMKNYTEEMLILLEDDKAAIDRLFNSYPDLNNFFTNRLDIEEMEINDMLKVAKEYAAENFYEIDEMGELALCAKLDDISGKNPVISIEDIEEVIDDAIEHANRISIKNIFGKFKKGKSEMGVLTEADFL